MQTPREPNEGTVRSGSSWTLSKRFTFEASHRLPNHDGKCARLHGHSWALVVEVNGSALHTEGPKAGMLVDFGDISRVVRPLVDDFLDHHHLNDTTDLDDPTSETLARWVYDRLAWRLPGLVAVVIAETCTSSCRYEVRP